MAKILITGSDGYIGSKLNLALKEKGYIVEEFDLPMDICNYEEVDAAVRDKNIVYHLAALAVLKYTDENPEETFKVNVIGTENICRACAKYNVLLNFISTCCVYGEPLETPSREDGLVNPVDNYAASKLAGEYLIKGWQMSKGLRYNILRIGTTYGPSLKPEMRSDMCIPSFIYGAIRKEKLLIFGDGFQQRQYIYIDDLIKAMIAVADKGIENHILNICGEERVTVRELANMVLNIAGLPFKDYVKFVGNRKMDFVKQDISIAKAKKLLGWRPEVKFAEGLKKYYDYIYNRLTE